MITPQGRSYPGNPKKMQEGQIKETPGGWHWKKGQQLERGGSDLKNMEGSGRILSTAGTRKGSRQYVSIQLNTYN